MKDTIQPELIPNEVPKIMDELRGLMVRLSEIDPDAVTRIEECVRKFRVERCVERHLDA